ncbi:hypothetical protein [Streptomyces radicis]|uniref:Peptidoglycan-binding protein n=1 Tax=Streptomyces radicis TaxID=1750517 RepID=A0A3A9WDL9_9ACTN|nr:hypothetical protein [Streptomyces radicis]RKN11431.1 hypothetical protein D7319_05665 [Streptomyces radicis]RKN26549.1 hypothetical protein D7318_03995 [Streptomyces radicis]
MRMRSVLSAVGAVGAAGALVLGSGGVAAAESADVAPLVTKISHSQATSMFQASGITWSSSGGCSDRNVPTCTSFDQLNLESAQGAQTLRSASGCSLNITGGTETGHAGGTYSHWNGYKLDFGLNGCIDGYITGVFTYIGQRGDGAALYESGSGNVYAREGNHWDVTYYNCGGC